MLYYNKKGSDEGPSPNIKKQLLKRPGKGWVYLVMVGSFVTGIFIKVIYQLGEPFKFKFC